MDWLNYHHLHYFWMVAKEGTIARACEKLRLAQPTISGQLKQFEESLGLRSGALGPRECDPKALFIGLGTHF